MRIVDAHTHLQDVRYDDDRDAVIRRARAAGIVMVNVGTDRSSSEAALALAREHADMYATVGQHPADSAEGFDALAYEAMAEDPRVVAIGECGLDYFHEKTEMGRERQKDLFIRQIELAHLCAKPLMIHCREAFADLIALLRAHTRRLHEPHAGIVHFFSGTEEEADALTELGFAFSFGGVLTFTADYDGVVRRIPLEKIVVETDAPYVAPTPHRGKRNEPAFIVETAKRVAELKNLEYDELIAKTTENAREILGIQI